MKMSALTWKDALEYFLLEYLPRERGFSPRTQESYGTALRLLRAHVGERVAAPHELTARQVLGFLDVLETKRGNLPATRNLRLAAIKSFCQALRLRDPERREAYERLLAIPGKRDRRRSPDHLEREELRHLFAGVDPRTAHGFRDLTLLRYLYNTGSRISEVTGARIGWLSLAESAQVEIRGKGGKCRVCPLWRSTAEMLRLYLRQERARARPGWEETVFLTRRGRGFSRSGLWKLLHGYLERAGETMPSLRHKKLTPHSLRHTTAIHLLQAGVEVTVIKSWLGHADIAVTSRYLDLDLDKKRAVLERFADPDGGATAAGGSVKSGAVLPAKLLEWLEKQ